MNYNYLYIVQLYRCFKELVASLREKIGGFSNIILYKLRPDLNIKVPCMWVRSR